MPFLPSAIQAILMLLFVPPRSFESCGEYPYHRIPPSHLLAGLMVVVSLAALSVTLCHALIMLLVGASIELQSGFGPPASLRVMLAI